MKPLEGSPPLPPAFLPVQVAALVPALTNRVSALLTLLCRLMARGCQVSLRGNQRSVAIKAEMFLTS